MQLLKIKPAYASFLLQAGLMLLVLADGIRQALHHCIYIWDESIYALNSLEVSQGGRLLVYTVNGQLDHHNSKPPLVIWMQAIFTTIMGASELAVRLPSFLALAATLRLFLWYSRSITGSIRTGLLAGMGVLTCSALMRSHVFLSGDLDGMLCFFATGIFLERLLQLQKGKVESVSVYRMGIYFLLGYFTKSTAILFVLPPLAASFLISGHTQALLRLRATWIIASVSLLFIVAYYVCREQLDPGYWAVVWHTEFVRATTNVQPWLQFPFGIYWDDLSGKFFRWQLRLVFILLPLHWLLPVMKMRSLSLHASLIIVLYFLGLSLPASRLAWYAAPAYPLVCFLLAILLVEFTRFATVRIASAWLREAVMLLMVLPLFAWWAWQSRDYILEDTSHYEQPEYSVAFTKQLLRNYPQQQHFIILEDAELPRFSHVLDDIRWYVRASTCQNNKTKIEWRQNLSAVVRGDTVVSWQRQLWEDICKQYRPVELTRWTINEDTVRWLVIR